MPKLFRFIDASPDLKLLPRLFIRLGGERVTVVVDTGSKGIVLGSRWVPEGYPVMDPQPPKPQYSSSGMSYEGQWVLAHVELTDRAGQSFRTAGPVAVFRSTSVPGVTMMGVGTRWDDPGDVFNPLLNLPEVASGAYRKGYIVTREGIWFGYGEQEVATFNPLLFPSTPAAPARASVVLTPPAGAVIEPYTAAAPFLLDTGLGYMIVTPPNGEAEPSGYEANVLVTDPDTQEQVPREQWISGVAVSVALEGHPVWDFNTRDFGARARPLYARFGKGRVGSRGLINTGRHLLAKFDHLADVESGRVGLRAATTPPPHAVLPPGVNTTSSPSAVFLDGTTYVFYKGSTGDERMFMTRNASAADQGTWEPHQPLPPEINTSDGPSAAVIGSTIHVVYKGAGADTRIYVARSSDRGQSWSMAPLRAEVNTSTRPDAFVFGDALYVVYRGSGPDTHVYVAPVETGTAPHTVLPPGVNTTSSPSAVFAGGATYVFYKGWPGDEAIYMTRNASAPDQVAWEQHVRLPGEIQSSDAPSAVLIGTQLYVVYKGAGGDTGVYVARSPNLGAAWRVARLPAEVNTSTRPDAFVSGSLLYVVYRGSGPDTHVYVAPLPIDTVWKFL